MSSTPKPLPIPKATDPESQYRHEKLLKRVEARARKVRAAERRKRRARAAQNTRLLVDKTKSFHRFLSRHKSVMAGNKVRLNFGVAAAEDADGRRDAKQSASAVAMRTMLQAAHASHAAAVQQKMRALHARQDAELTSILDKQLEDKRFKRVDTVGAIIRRASTSGDDYDAAAAAAVAAAAAAGASGVGADGRDRAGTGATNLTFDEELSSMAETVDDSDVVVDDDGLSDDESRGISPSPPPGAGGPAAEGAQPGHPVPRLDVDGATVAPTDASVKPPAGRRPQSAGPVRVTGKSPTRVAFGTSVRPQSALPRSGPAPTHLKPKKFRRPRSAYKRLALSATTSSWCKTVHIDGGEPKPIVARQKAKHNTNAIATPRAPPEGIMQLQDAVEGRVHSRKTAKIEPFCYATCTLAGRTVLNPKSRNNDRINITCDMCENPNMAFFGITSGHGVHARKVTRFVSDNLADTVAMSHNFPLSARNALVEGYQLVHEMLVNESGIDCTYSGTSSISCLLIGTILWVANAGDCRACVGRFIHDTSGVSAVPVFDQKTFSPLIRDIPPVIAQYVQAPERTALQDPCPPNAKRPWTVVAPKPRERKKPKNRALALMQGAAAASSRNVRALTRSPGSARGSKLSLASAATSASKSMRNLQKVSSAKSVVTVTTDGSEDPEDLKERSRAITARRRHTLQRNGSLFAEEVMTPDTKQLRRRATLFADPVALKTMHQTAGSGEGTPAWLQAARTAADGRDTRHPAGAHGGPKRAATAPAATLSSLAMTAKQVEDTAYLTTVAVLNAPGDRIVPGASDGEESDSAIGARAVRGAPSRAGGRGRPGSAPSQRSPLARRQRPKSALALRGARQRRGDEDDEVGHDVVAEAQTAQAGLRRTGSGYTAASAVPTNMTELGDLMKEGADAMVQAEAAEAAKSDGEKVRDLIASLTGRSSHTQSPGRSTSPTTRHSAGTSPRKPPLLKRQSSVEQFFKEQEERAKERETKEAAAKAAASSKVVSVPLSLDSKPERPAERTRIIGKGGRVDRFRTMGKQVGPPRVWMMDQDLPGLAISRSIGDSLATSLGVTATPEVVKHVLHPWDKFLVLASKGVWQVMDSDTAVKIVYSSMISQWTPESAGSRQTKSRTRRRSSVVDIAASMSNPRLLSARQSTSGCGGLGFRMADGLKNDPVGDRMWMLKRLEANNKVAEDAAEALVTTARAKWAELQTDHVSDITAVVVLLNP